MPKYMANASFYRPKFRTIDLLTNWWVGGHNLTWWQFLSSCLPKCHWWRHNLNKHKSWKFLEIVSSFQGKNVRSFGLLEREIWAEHWTVSELQDRFGLLCCCYNLDLKTAFLNLGLHMKVVGLCLIFPSI
jgi:hypothetical protein